MLARRSEFKNVFSQLFTFSKPRLSSNHSLSAILNCLTKGRIDISNKDIKIKNVDVPQIGVRGRNSDNTLYRNNIGSSPNQKLKVGMEKTYKWIESQVKEV